MAETSEERKVRILLDAQQANASIRDMSAAAGIMNSQLAKMAADDPGRAALQQDFARLTARINEARTAQRTVIQTTEELAEAQRLLVAENREVVLNGQKVEATFNQMKAAAQQLERELHEMSGDDPGRAKMLADYRALQDRIEGVKKEMGEATDQGLTFKDALAFAGVAVTAEAALDMIKELGAEVIATTQELGKMRADINSLTGATGEELDQLTVGVRAVSQAFGKEYNEVLVASNALSKQMGISQQEALKLIEQGFIAGADVNGEFLDQMKEYPAQFKAAGVSASEFVAIVSKSQTDGVFSDKGADVVKEFGLRIREQTKATGDAMEAAFGTEFTQKLFKGINDGSISSVEALRLVSTQLNDTKIPAAQLQTVIADVFGGPGEDAGLEYLQSLRNIGGGIDSLIDQTNPYVQQQQALLASQKDLAGAQNELAKQFEGTGNSMQVLANEGMTFLYTLLVSLGATFKELYEPIGQIWAELLKLGESLGLVSKEGSLAKDIANGIGVVLRLVLTPTRLLWGVLADLAKSTVAWVKSSRDAQTVLYIMIAPLRLLFDMLRDSPAFFEGFSAAARASFTQVGKAWKAIMAGDISGAIGEFDKIGGAAGRAYLKAFDATRANRPAAATATTSAGGEQPDTRPGAAGDGTTQAERDKAAKAAQAEREKLRKQREAEAKKALEAQAKLERDVQKTLEDAQLGAIRDKHEREIAEISLQTDRKMAALQGSEAQILAQWEALEDERQSKIAAVRDKQAEEEQKRRQEALDEKIAREQADEEQALAELDVKLANGVLNEWAFQDAVYAVKQAALERELALVKERSGEESAEYQKLVTEKLKNEADYITKKKALGEEDTRFAKGVTAVKKMLGSDEVNFVMEYLGKQTVLYKAFKQARKAAEIADVGIKYVSEMQSIAKAAAENPFNGVTAGVAGATQLAVQGTLATVRAGVAVAKIAGFRQGGNTGTAPAASALPGLLVGTNGKLLDAEGFPVAGVVHENEYVIPEWMRADPQVVQVEQWLEHKRLGGPGFRAGGATSNDVVVPAATPAPDQVQLQTQLLEVLTRLDSRLGDVEQWRRNLQVVQHTGELINDIDYTKAVIQSAEIR